MAKPAPMNTSKLLLFSVYRPMEQNTTMAGNRKR